ncbi:hypothetical protein J6590_015027 [Homalodisca vitripennis]|nr:hypothetical protein J6590_015027 [Homalodisca vitripennis]
MTASTITSRPSIRLCSEGMPSPGGPSVQRADVTTPLGALNGVNALEAYLGSQGTILELRDLLPFPLSLLG